jgi:hypothetical protein
MQERPPAWLDTNVPHASRVPRRQRPSSSGRTQTTPPPAVRGAPPGVASWWVHSGWPSQSKEATAASVLVYEGSRDVLHHAGLRAGVERRAAGVLGVASHQAARFGYCVNVIGRVRPAIDVVECRDHVLVAIIIVRLRARVGAKPVSEIAVVWAFLGKRPNREQAKAAGTEHASDETARRYSPAHPIPNFNTNLRFVSTSK